MLPCEVPSPKATAHQDEVPVLKHLLADSPLLRGTKVGGDDAPTVFLVAPPSEELTKYVLEDPRGPFSRTLEWPDRLFDEVDGKNEPDTADHAPGSWKKWSFQFSKREPFLLKADWHSVHGWGNKFDIFVPRKNAVVPVRQAPPRVLALIEAFRNVNDACWQEISAGLQELLEQKPDDILRPGKNDLVALRQCRAHALSPISQVPPAEDAHRGVSGARLFRRHRSAGWDVDGLGVNAESAIQAGPARRKEMHWHRDGATGLLHLGWLGHDTTSTDMAKKCRTLSDGCKDHFERAAAAADASLEREDLVQWGEFTKASLRLQPCRSEDSWTQELWMDAGTLGILG